MLALAFGVAVALLLEYLDDPVKSPEDIERDLRLPALAVIPLVGKMRSQRLLPLPSVFQASDGTGSGRELLIHSDGPSRSGFPYIFEWAPGSSRAHASVIPEDKHSEKTGPPGGTAS
jgi:hypothetical protein